MTIAGYPMRSPPILKPYSLKITNLIIQYFCTKLSFGFQPLRHPVESLPDRDRHHRSASSGG
ncbi:hypothetical protein ACN4EK_12245 [Pantanalinema rosaneae CENA516]|uniref:hypothetical protein n=1 Tax=Pantanalinema rosaneae TaxID=1620701 RepID=UPI003D6E5AF9